MTLRSRQPRVKCGVQVIIVSRFEFRRLLDAHIPPVVSRIMCPGHHRESSRLLDAHSPPSVNRDAVKIASRLKNVAEYEPQIPPRFNRITVKKSSRFKIMTDYERQIPPKYTANSDKF